MFKHSGSSAHPAMTRPLFGAGGPRKRAVQWAEADPRAPQSPRRLQPLWKDADDGELTLPDVLLKRPGETDGRARPMAPSVQSVAAGHRRLVIAATSAGGLLVALAGGLMVFAGAPAVRTGQVPEPTMAAAPATPAPQASVPAAARASGSAGAAPVAASASLGGADFSQRFGSAETAATADATLEAKIQNRLHKSAAAGVANPATVAAPASQSTPAAGPLLGYVTPPAADPAAGNGQQAIATATRPQLAPDTAPSVSAAFGETASITLDVNLRSAATKDSDVLGVVPGGAVVELGSCDDWWCEIRHYGRTGFVSRQFIAGKS